MTDTIKLDQFLKLQGVTVTGGQAKLLIQSGEVWVNGAQETRRGRQLQPGDQVRVGPLELEVQSDEEES